MNKGKNGQVAIETAAAIIAVFIFFLGILQVFVWISSVLVQRQEYYEQSRRLAGHEKMGEFTWTPDSLTIFNGGGN